MTVSLTICLFLPQIGLATQAYHNFDSILKNELRLQILSDRITYLDEVLTMSARMNAATGDRSWERRYKLFEPQLDSVIKESIEIAPQAYESKDAILTDKANKRLVTMEMKSFELVREGRQQEAEKLLSSSEYETEKINYAVGVASRNRAIQNQLENKVKDYRFDLLTSSSISISSLAMLIPLWLLVLHLLKEYVKQKLVAQIAFKKANQKLESNVEARTQELTQRNYQLKVILNKLKTTQIQLIHTEKMSSLGQMIAGIAHEINNPVSFIYGNVTYIREYVNHILELLGIYEKQYPQKTPEIEELSEVIELDFIKNDLNKILESMYFGTERIKEIVLSLRNFSRLDESDFKQVDIHEGMDSTLMILKNRLRSQIKGTEINLIKEYGDIPLVECYPSQLNQVFMNIIINAIDILESKFSGFDKNKVNADDSTNINLSHIPKECEKKKFQPIIIITTKLIDDKKVQVIISDNGKGITQKLKQKMFDPFFTTKPVGKGTGLGLSISYQIIVNKHKGRLFCNSRINEGTDFVIEIPIHQKSQSSYK